MKKYSLVFLVLASSCSIFHGKKEKAAEASTLVAMAGQAIYEKSCGTCHALKNPSKFTIAQWNQIVPDMVGKVNQKSGTPVLSARDQQQILDYVLASAKK